MNTFKFILISATFALLSLGSLNLAKADHSHGDYDYDYDYGIQVRDLGNGKIRVSKDVYLFKRQHDFIPIKRHLKLRKYNGYKLKKVVIKASTARGHGKAHLEINGIQEGAAQQVGVYEDRYAFRLQNYNNVLGKDIRKVQVHTRGRFTITKIIAVLKKDYNNGGYIQNVSNHVGMNFGPGTGNLLVGRELKLRQHKGKKLLSVSITAESLFNRPVIMGEGRNLPRNRRLPRRRGPFTGTATLLVDGLPVGAPQFIPAYGKMTFQMPYYNNIIKVDFKRVQIQFTGDVYVQDVSAQIQDSYYYGGGYNGGYDRNPGPVITRF